MDLFSASFYLFLMKKMKYYSWYLTKSAKMALSKHFLVNEPKSFERSHYVTKSSKIMRKLFQSHFQHRINFSYNTQFSCCELRNFSNHNNDKKYQIDSYENLVQIQLHQVIGKRVSFIPMPLVLIQSFWLYSKANFLLTVRTIFFYASHSVYTILCS